MAWHRHNKSALNQDKVVAVMKDALEEMLDGRKDTMVQKLAGAQEQCKTALQLFLDKFSNSMSDEGMMPFCWDKGGAKTDLLPRLVRVCSEPQAPESAEAAVFKQILEWVRKEEERQAKRAKKDAKAKAAESAAANGEEASPEEADGHAAVGAEAEATADGAGAEGGGSGGGGGNFGLLLQVITHMGGFMKISAPRPSTSFFGNDGISQAVKRLSDGSRQVDMSSNPYMGKAKGNDKSVAEIRLTDKDSEQTINDQWAMFREEFLSYNSAFLFHQINHYSLIYGMREWVDYRGRRHRQVLTAKRGQRPTAWLTYEEVRRILLSWHGYKIIKITRIFPRDFVGDWKVGGQLAVYIGPPRLPTPPEEDVHWDLDVFFGRKTLSDVAKELHVAAANLKGGGGGGKGGGGGGSGRKKKIKKKSSGLINAKLGMLAKQQKSASKKGGPKGGSASAVSLPDYLEKKVTTPGYDMEADTSLTDDDLALLEDWKAGGGVVPDKVEGLPGDESPADIPLLGPSGAGTKPARFGSELSKSSGSRSARSGSKSSRSERSNSSGGSSQPPRSPRPGGRAAAGGGGGGGGPKKKKSGNGVNDNGSSRRGSTLSSATSSIAARKTKPKGPPKLTNRKAAAAKKAPSPGVKRRGKATAASAAAKKDNASDSDGALSEKDDNSATTGDNDLGNGNGGGGGGDNDDTPTKKRPPAGARRRAVPAKVASPRKKPARRPLISKEDDSDSDDSSSSDDDDDVEDGGGDAPSSKATLPRGSRQKKLPALAIGRKAGPGGRRRVSVN